MASISPASGSSMTSSGGFPDRVKMEIRNMVDGKCWNCLTPIIEVCHVFAREDWYLESLLRSRGLLDYDLTSTENAIGLCPNCHVNFDHSSDPGFVFVPSDLDYFIRFEEDDYEKREREAANGLQSHRVCPSAAMYREYQESRGDLPIGSLGGLYRRIFLIDYIPSLPQSSRDEVKSWHGNPMASIRRGILATGTMRIDKFPKETVGQLRKLQELYARPDPIVHAEFIVGHCKVDNVESHPTYADPNPVQPGISSSSAIAHGLSTGSMRSVLLFGPEQSAQDVIKRYDGLLRGERKF